MVVSCGEGMGFCWDLCCFGNGSVLGGGGEPAGKAETIPCNSHICIPGYESNVRSHMGIVNEVTTIPVLVIPTSVCGIVEGWGPAVNAMEWTRELPN